MKAENKEVLIDAQVLRESSTEELQAALKEAEDNLFVIRSKAAVGATRTRPNYQKPHLVKGYKRLIARIKTILRERKYETA